MNEKNTKATENVEIDPGMSVMPEEPGLMDVPTVIPELDSVLAAMPTALPAYQTTTWKNKPSTETPVDAAVMTRVEQRLVDLTTAVNGLRDSVSQALPCTGIGITGDFDNCTKAGAYIVSADSGSNMGFPSGAYKWGTLIVFARQGKYIIQIYIADSVNEPVYMRNAFDGSPFRNWTKIARTSMQPSVSQSPLAGAKKFMMKTTKARVTFDAAGGHRGFLAFSSGNSTPWLAVYTQNTVLANIQRLGNVTVEKASDDVCDITAPQWSMLVIIPLSGTIEITDAQPSVSRTVAMDDTVKASIVASSNQKGELELRFTSKTGDKMQVTFFNSENNEHIVMWNSTKSKVEWSIQPSASRQVKFSAHIESATLSQNVTSGGEEPIMVRIKTDDPSHDYALCVHKSKRIELYDYVSEKSVWPANLTSLCS